MERLVVVSAVLVCLLIVDVAHGSPFFFPESDCYQPTETPYTGGYGDYQGPGYQETVREMLRALQEIVYLTVRAAKEELSQLVSLWVPPCDSGAYPGDSAGVTQGDVSGGTWVQGETEQNTPGGEISTLDNKVGTENTSLSSSSSESSMNGTRKKTTTNNTTVVTQEQTVGVLNPSTSKYDALNSTALINATDNGNTSESITEETTTETVTTPN